MLGGKVATLHHRVSEWSAIGRAHRRGWAGGLLAGSLLALLPAWSGPAIRSEATVEAIMPQLTGSDVVAAGPVLSLDLSAFPVVSASEAVARPSPRRPAADGIGRPLAIEAAPLAEAIDPQRIASLADAAPFPLVLASAQQPKPDAPLQPERPRQVARTAAIEPKTAYIEQLTTETQRSLHVPQLHEPGAALASAVPLADRVAAMQVLPPPPKLSPGQRAALLAEAPEAMMLRIDGEAVGEIAIRMDASRSFSVQLAGLLDALGDRFDGAEFERLRNSAAADSWIGVDDLRAMGLGIAYDPVYDELKLTA